MHDSVVLPLCCFRFLISGTTIHAGALSQFSPRVGESRESRRSSYKPLISDMPIEVNTRIQAFDQEEFHALDRRIMRVVFDVHNEFGRLFDEDLYKFEIAARCVDLGLKPAEREVRIRVQHETFIKDYFMDILICHGFMLEAKVADQLAPTHRGQSLNYILLAGLNHGRLVNLRSERIQHEYVSTTLTREERRRFRVMEVNGLSRTRRANCSRPRWSIYFETGALFLT